MPERTSDRGGRSGPGPPPPRGDRPGEGRGDRPEYTVYRSRREGAFSKLRSREGGSRFRGPGRGERDRPGRKERGWGDPRRVIKIVLAVLAAWILLSVALFFISAGTTEGVSNSAEEALSDEGNLVTGSTILVLGSDERPKRIREQLAARGEDPGEGGRADSILLLHASLGSVRRLSILRDSFAEIPGQTPQKINSAYFLGGPELMIETVEGFLGNGVQIDHLIEVDFAEFADLIDALGGVDVKAANKICAPGFDGAGEGVNLSKGENHLGGREALAFARVRNNPCAPQEDDRDRAARQQEVLSGIRSQALSPSTFLRLPWVSWQAPRAIETDLEGPGLSMLFLDLLTGGTGETTVLEPEGQNADGSLIISEEARAQAVEELVGESN